ncbi:ribonuclease III [Punctularia strigosozonata HHB-11173 SS5]|uniref:ribonuclease III n=1 Tax=Punctularia strigosozonata (strain HHB-11173) TaxID=741275 RepID=UPI0004416581|nr:ribonuclease III [Punctularia strigosozonata HHB-11173 SS5]EIN10713.1 ribonuclease III [Punctularia strigosozonata HHB-11173 SS5]
MPYFLVPMGSVQADELQRMDVASRVQWDQVHLAANAWAVPLNLTSVEALGHDVEDAVVQDKSAEFCRRYEVERLRTDMSPLSSPGDSKREAGFASFLEYCKVQSTRAAESITDYNQPLLQVTRLGGSVNFLNPLLSGPDESHKADAKYLIPQLCPKFSIPASIFKTGLYLPSLARRIDEMLLVKELNAEILHDLVGEQLLLEAITPPSASAEFNYERLELLGDAFLKYLASVYVYVTRQGGEGALHNARQKLIANDYLMDCAVRVGLPPYIQSAAFAYKYWAPHNVRVLARPTDDMTCGPSQDANGEKSIEEPKKEDAGIPSKRKAKFDPNTSQWLGHKAIADVVEAIIGAAYLNGGSDNALQTVLDLGIDLSGISSWTDFRRLSASDPGHPQLVLPSQSVVELSRILGRPVNDRQLLAHALACGGLTGAVPILRQRLEFLGDAILEYLLIRYLYSKNQSSSPGILSAGMVSNDALAALCVTSGIYEHLLVDRRSELYRTTQNYRKLILQRQQAENAAARAELRSPGQFWHDVPAPKVLSDAMEATLGALYVSDGFTADGTQIVFERLFKPFYDRHVTLQTLSHHPNKILAELLQKQGCQDFEFRKADEHEATLLAHGRSDNAIAVCTVIVHGVILAVGEGESIAAATRAASLQALDAVEGDPGFIFRNCRCKARGQAKRGQSKKTKEKPLADVEGSSVRPSDS